MANINIYNLYPRLIGNIKNWYSHIPIIKNMGFNYIYINPITECGGSGSLYAVKSYYDYNSDFFENGVMLYAENDLKKFIAECYKNDIKIMLDLVINHSAKDSPLTIEYTNWYKYEEDGTLKSPGAWDNGQWISWGDLAEFDNDKKEDNSHEEIWEYWKELIKHNIELGVTGFRCDAAYKVPSELWQYLISYAKKQKKDVIFFAESLGCSMEETIELIKCGFDYIASSAKWWDYTSNWFLKQYEETRMLVKQVSFPENHDTERLITECKGNIDKLKMHCLFTSIVSNAWMITFGFEYGAKKRCDVVHDNIGDREPVAYDITDYLKRLIKYVSKNNILSETGKLEPIALLSETEEELENIEEISEYEEITEETPEESEAIDEIFSNNYSYVRAFYKYSLDEKKKLLLFINTGEDENVIDVSAFNVKKDISFDENINFETESIDKYSISIKPYQIKIFEINDE